MLILCPQLLAMEPEKPPRLKMDPSARAQSWSKSGSRSWKDGLLASPRPGSPRSKELIGHGCFILTLPFELLVQIIFCLLDKISLDTADNHDVLRLRNVHNAAFSFRSSCKAINALMLEGIHLYYLSNLTKYTRPEKIQLAQSCYTLAKESDFRKIKMARKNYFQSLAFILTSILHESDSEDLFAKDLFLQKLVSNEFLSIDNNSLRFKLITDEDQNLIEDNNLEIEDENKGDLTEKNDHDDEEDFTQDALASESNLKFIEILLELKLSTDNLITFDIIFETVLSASKNEELLEYLIDLDWSDDSSIENYISTKLMLKSLRGKFKAFKAVVDESRHDLFIESPKGFNAIIWAMIGERTELLSYAFANLQNEVFFAPNTQNKNIFHFAALYGNPKILTYLFDKLTLSDNFTSILNLKNNDNRTPLFLAIMNGQEANALLLLRNGADIKLLSTFPIYEGKSEMLKQIIENIDVLNKIAAELSQCKKELKDLSKEDIIACCKKSHAFKDSCFQRLKFFGTTFIALVIYGLACLN